MSSRVAAALALAGSTFASEVSPDVIKAYEQFKNQYGKNFAGEENEMRLKIFEDNYHFIKEENAKGNPYTVGLNEFADLTQEEYRVRLGLRPSEKKSAAFQGMSYLGKHTRGNAKLPDSVDWRNKAVTDVKNQAQCGSCWAFSSTGALEGAWQIASGKLVTLSEQQLVDCSKASHGCEGGSMEGSFAYEHKHEVCTEDSYPYTAKDGTCHATGCTVGIPEGGVKGYKDVEQEDMEALMEAVAQQPVSVAIEADLREFQLYTGGVLTGKCGTALDHGVLAVGYGEEDGQKYWLVKNSWGPSWGDHGYIKIARDTDDTKGECGIQMDASYPVMTKQAADGDEDDVNGHYGHPPCQADEAQAAVQGAGGVLCAPQCKGNSCPSDVPAGTTASPQCVLKDTSGHKYCALMCGMENDAGCPQGAKCSALGICIYPEEVGFERDVLGMTFDDAARETTISI